MRSTSFPRAIYPNAASQDDAEADRFDDFGAWPGDAHRPAPAAGFDRPTPQSTRVVNLHGNEQSYMKPKGSTQASNAFPKFGGIEGPAWQDYFFLAPNVRFTRTPDCEVRKPRPDEQADAGQAQAKAAATPVQQAKPQAAAAPAAPVPGAPAPAVSSQRPAQEVARPQPPAAPVAARPAPAVARPSLERVVEKEQVLPSARPAPVAPAPIAVQAPAASATEAATPAPGVAVTRWSYLSDHAFFEAMAPDTIEAPAPVALAEPAVSPAAPAPAPAAAAPAPAPAAARTSPRRGARRCGGACGLQADRNPPGASRRWRTSPRCSASSNAIRASTRVRPG